MSAQPHPAVAALNRATPLVLLLVAAKLLVERLDFEFVEGSPMLITTVIGAVLLVGLMLTERVQDHKEAGRLSARNAAAIEAIRLEGAYAKRLHPAFDADRLASRLGRISETVATDALGGRQEAIAAVEALTESFLELDRLGVSPECIVGLKREQARIVANLMRAASMQRIGFLPAAYTLVETVVAGLIALLMFTRVASASTEALVLGVSSLVLLCLLRLLRPADSAPGATAAGLGGVRA